MSIPFKFGGDLNFALCTLLIFPTNYVLKINEKTLLFYELLWVFL